MTNKMIAPNLFDLSMSHLGNHHRASGISASRYGGIIVSNGNRIPARVGLTVHSDSQKIEVRALHVDHLAEDEQVHIEVGENDRVMVSGRSVSLFDSCKLDLWRYKKEGTEEYGPWEPSLSGVGSQLGNVCDLSEVASRLATLTALHDLTVAVVDHHATGLSLVSGLISLSCEVASSKQRRDYDAEIRRKAMGAIMDLAKAEISIKMAEAGLSMTEITNGLGLTPREQSALWGQIVDCSSPQMPFSGDSVFQHLTGHDTFEANQKKLEKKILSEKGQYHGFEISQVREAGCGLGDRLTERLEQMRVDMAHGDALYEDHQRDIYEEAEVDHHDNADVDADVDAELVA